MSKKEVDESFGLKDATYWVQEAAATPQFLYPTAMGTVNELAKQFPMPFNHCCCIFSNDFVTWTYEENDMETMAGFIFEQLVKDYYWMDKYLKKWSKYLNELEETHKEIDKTDLKDLSNKKLVSLYVKFIRSYIKEYALPLLADPVGVYAEERIRKLVEDKVKDKDLQNKYIEILSTVTKKSFINDSEESLLKIISLISDNNALVELFKTKKPLEIEEELEKYEEIDEMLDEHSAKFFWLQNSYVRTKILDKLFFIGEIKYKLEKLIDPEEDLRKIKEFYESSEREKKQIIKDHNFSIEEETLVNMTCDFSHWMDNRKKACLKSQHYQAKLLNEVESRTKYAYHDLQYTLPTEIEEVMDHKISKEEIEKRKNLFVFKCTRGEIELFTGKKAKEIQDILTPKPDETIKEFQGICASRGKVEGNVKVILDAHHGEKLEKGDILVTTMTRPDFVPLMKKAAAIITDEGGLTCHAAIIAREMGIPCIIATKISTRVLKDNEKVEVNANEGIVRRLE